MRNKLISFGLIGYLALLLVSPVFGWHIHHACAEGTHGFEAHSTNTHDDNHHGEECQAESLVQHTLEKCTFQADLDYKFTPDFTTLHLVGLQPSFLSLLPSITKEFNFLAFDPDIGTHRYFQSAISLRAPPTLLS